METDTLDSSVAFNVSLNHGELVYVTVSCYNKVGLLGVLHSKPTPVILEKPNAGDGYVTFHMQPQTHYRPHGKEQASAETVEFSYHNFANTEMDFVDHYEAQQYQRDWVSISKLDYISITNMEQNAEYRVSVRAVNAMGMCSNTIMDVLTINSGDPKLTGMHIVCKSLLNNNSILRFTSPNLVIFTNVNIQYCQILP